MVYVEGVPTQLLAVGVTVMVAIMGAVDVLVPVNPAIFPDPVAPSPILVVLLFQV